MAQNLLDPLQESDAVNSFRLSVIAAVLGVGGCSTLQPIPDHPGAIASMESYYAAHAWEEGARCVLPSMQVTQTKVIEDQPDRLVVEARYYWEDGRTQSDGGANICSGFNTRTFTLSQGQVTDMTGEQRPGR